MLNGEPNLIGWLGKTEVLDGRTLDLQVITSEPESQFTLRLGEKVEVLPTTCPDAATGRSGCRRRPARLVAGRLAANRTPDGVEVTGAADLDLLRRVFPGY